MSEREGQQAGATAFGIGDLLAQVLQTAVGYGIGGAISPAIETAAQPEAKRLWALNPSRPTDAQLAAQAAATGRVARDWAVQEARFQGIGHDPFAAMEALALSPPALAELFELLRRGHLSEGQLQTAFKRLGVEPDYHGALLDLRRVHLSPQDAAMARQQGFLDPAQARAVAALGGVEAADADLQFELSGLPYGIGEALDLLRRGKIDEARFRQVVREGHTKTKYEDDLLQLRFQPLSAAVAAEALIRERMSEADAVRIAAENGMQRDDFLAWSNMLGRPPGIMEALTLVNRGHMTKADFHEVVARSDVRTEYVDDLFNLRVRYPSLFQLRGLISSGAVSDERAIQLVTEQGYPHDLAAGVVKAAHGAKTTHHKTISLAIIEQLYESGLETREWFTRELERLGYDETDRADLIDVLQVRRLVSEVTHALGLLRSRYVGWKIERGAVVEELDKLLTDPEVRTRLLKLWDDERETNRPQLTIAQVGQALHWGRFTVEQAIARWEAMGLSPDDALTHAWIVAKGDPRPASA